MESKPINRPVRLLFATNSDAGQYNVHLAVIQSMLQHHHKADVEIHLLTNAAGRQRCPKGVTYHEIPGPSMGQVLKSRAPLPGVVQTGNELNYRHAPTFLGVLKAISVVPQICSPNSASAYVANARAIEAVLDSVKPDFIVADPLLAEVADAAFKLGLPSMILSPNAWKDNAMAEQKLGVFSWPAMGTGWYYPLQLWLRPLNIILVLAFALSFLFDPTHRRKMAARKEAGYFAPYLFEARPLTMCMGLPELEFPGVRPSHVIPVGPILLPSSALNIVDPELDAWINHPKAEGMFTISFALGTHAVLNQLQAEELLRMFSELMEQRSDIRVIAKIMRAGTYDLPLLDELEGQFGSHRLKIVEWMQADPISLLRTGKVDLSIHHGGSNSYHEALSLGIPQIAVASWLDCYDFAARIEHLGIGRWGNKKAGPDFTPSELLEAILSVLNSYPDIAMRASQCAEIASNAGEKVRRHDGGVLDVPKSSEGSRDIAAEWIYEKARSVMR